MNGQNERKDLSDDARLTALALGELDDAERAALEQELEGDAEGRAALDEIRAMAGALEGELATELDGDASSAGLSAAARVAIEAKAAGTSSGRVVDGSGRFRRVALVVGGLAAVAAGVAALVNTMDEKAAPAPYTYTLFGGADTSAPVGASADAGSVQPPRGNPPKRPEAERPVQLAAAERAMRSKDKSQFALGRELQALGYSGGEDRNLRRREAIGDRLSGLGYVEGDSEAYDAIIENAFILAAEDPMSTFSIDVDTASYANVRRFLNSGQLPPADAVRIEEMINYFSYDYERTDGSVPFSITTEVASAPWNPSNHLVRIGLRGDEIPIFEPKEKNLVFLIDVSGSMSNAAKLPLLKRSMRLLVDNLSARDRVGIVVYAGNSGVVLPPTPGDRKEEIVAAIEALEPGGSTHGSQGIELAYALCESVRAEGGVNRVILATDGDFNVGVTSDDALVDLIERKREGGVSLSVLGFGSGNLKDSKMEKLADHGNGNYAYIDSLDEARKVLVREMGGTLETIAKDVKIQVVFEPAYVESFRLIGYENRMLAHEDFDDDTKDAGEIGAGHRVTALYEVVPRTEPSPGAERMAVVRLRYKQPDGDESRLIERSLARPVSLDQASYDLRFAAGVAAFGMVLRGSEHAGDFRLRDAYDLAFSGAHDDPFGYRQEFLRLVQRAIELDEAQREGR